MAAPTPEQCAEWRDNPSKEKLRLMTDAVMILAAKAEDKERIDAYLRELRRLPMMFAPLPTRSAPTRPELTAASGASSVPPPEAPSELASDSASSPLEFWAEARGVVLHENCSEDGE